MSTSPYSRTTRTVRIKSKNGNYFADVEILMAVSLTLPNGFLISYNISTPVDPLIVDDTGDGNGRAGTSNTTRSSHMARLTGDPTTSAKSQFFDVEVCDSFTITGPNNTQHLINCPSTKSVPTIVDDAGGGLAITPPSDTQTRCQHVVKYTQQIPGATAAPFDNPANFAYGRITDCMTFNGPPWGMPYVTEAAPSTSSDLPVYGTGHSPSDYSDAPMWYDFYGLVFDAPDIVVHGALQPGAACIDATQYVTNPNTGQIEPPPPDPNVDLNVYVYFPDSSGGPWLGTPVPLNSDGSTPTKQGYNGIDMGPIWWIRQLGTYVNVWYWFINPVQQPYAWSFFGDNPAWGYRGYTLLPDFSVSWILSVNYPLVNMGTYGAPDIETAASGYTSNGSLTVNWYGLGIPDGTFAVSTYRYTTGGSLGAGLPLLGYIFNTYYMPYGAFDLLGPTSAERLAAVRAAGLNTSAYTDYGGPTPNIWELTGIQQPPLTNPSKVWNPTTNPHLAPSNTLAQQVVQKFVSNWNEVANAINSVQHSLRANPDGSLSAAWRCVPPPAWSWAKPYGGDTVGTAQMFNNGWVPGVLPGTVNPATVPTIAAGQLDNSIWNNTPALSGSPPWRWATGLP